MMSTKNGNDDIVFDQIMRAARTAYCSLSNPTWFFVERAIASEPYKGLLAELATRCQLSDETEPNTDVCLTFSLRADGQAWLLQLSLVGPYAVLRDITFSDTARPASDDQNLTAIGHWILQALRQRDIAVISREILETPLPLHLSDIKPELTLVYQALFSQLEGVPWSDTSAG